MWVYRYLDDSLVHNDATVFILWVVNIRIAVFAVYFIAIMITPDHIPIVSRYEANTSGADWQINVTRTWRHYDDASSWLRAVTGVDCCNGKRHTHLAVYCRTASQLDRRHPSPSLWPYADRSDPTGQFDATAGSSLAHDRPAGRLHRSTNSVSIRRQHDSQISDSYPLNSSSHKHNSPTLYWRIEHCVRFLVTGLHRLTPGQHLAVLF